MEIAFLYIGRMISIPLGTLVTDGPDAQGSHQFDTIHRISNSAQFDPPFLGTCCLIPGCCYLNSANSVNSDGALQLTEFAMGLLEALVDSSYPWLLSF